MIFAAGLGTRLKPFTEHHPKALAKIGETTLLEHNIRYLQRYGIRDVIVNVHHFASQIIEALEYNNGFGSRVAVSDEQDAVLETGGGLKKAAPFFDDGEDLVVMNVDVVTNLNLGQVIQEHQRSEAVATLAVMRRASTRQLLFDDHNILCGWTNVQTGEQRISREVLSMNPRAFSGVQVLSPGLLNMPFQGKFSMIDVYLHAAKKSVIKAFDHTGDVFLDVGKPEALEQAGALMATMDYSL